MAYTKQTWVDGSGGGTAISAARLTHIENGIEGADTSAGTAVTTASNAETTANNAETTANQAASDVATLSGQVASAVTASDFTAKGELIVADGAASNITLSPGSDGRFLETDSSDANGIKWGRKITVSATQPSSPQVGDLWLQT